MANYMSKSSLKSRGWTDSAIAVLLGECDRRPKNPFCDTWRRPELFDSERVIRAEATEEFKSLRSSKAKRNETGTPAKVTMTNQSQGLF